jgi:plastocyanin
MPELGRAGLRRIAMGGLALALFGIGAGALALTAGDAPLQRIAQKGRAFAPGAVALKIGESVEIVNDDGDLVHHAYIEHPDFNFDTGEQIPGSRIVVTFPAKGSFTVLCGIHPKMKLAVTVK